MYEDMNFIIFLPNWILLKKRIFLISENDTFLIYMLKISFFSIKRFSQTSLWEKLKMVRSLMFVTLVSFT